MGSSCTAPKRALSVSIIRPARWAPSEHILNDSTRAIDVKRQLCSRRPRAGACAGRKNRGRMRSISKLHPAPGIEWRAGGCAAGASARKLNKFASPAKDQKLYYRSGVKCGLFRLFRLGSRLFAVD
ncbi:hypothetical protein EVAR_84538_1 [Eumeta japonica]|uniref:Uncharacterized protein n=1 Tax=Eumeta variegata TaxID=151549 RepID=A0A4C1UI33_EUMVA|nr:hypothetical protein EVAR_84538_1 [Eumeta japonica]